MANLLIEIGNTALKAAWSDGMTLGKTFRYQGEKCLDFILSLTHREKAMVLSNYALGTVDYHVIGTSEEKDLISLIDSQLIEWANDGTLRRWYEAYDLLYDLA